MERPMSRSFGRLLLILLALVCCVAAAILPSSFQSGEGRPVHYASEVPAGQSSVRSGTLSRLSAVSFLAAFGDAHDKPVSSQMPPVASEEGSVPADPPPPAAPEAPTSQPEPVVAAAPTPEVESESAPAVEAEVVAVEATPPPDPEPTPPPVATPLVLSDDMSMCGWVILHEDFNSCAWLNGQIYDGAPVNVELNKLAAQAIMLHFPGFDPSTQFECLDALWTHEAGWHQYKPNYAGSGAYGIPQSLPGSKMAQYGSDWEWNPLTQIEWGLNYIASRYSTPCGAWDFWQSNNWY